MLRKHNQYQLLRYKAKTNKQTHTRKRERIKIKWQMFT